MSKYLPTFDELAAERGYRRCRGMQLNGQQCFENHRRGSTGAEYWPPADGNRPVIHWADRRPSRQGIKQFLYLIALAEQDVAEERWRRQYRALRQTVKYLQEAHVRVPAEAWYVDKTRLKSRLIQLPTTDEEREAAMDWAKGG